MNYDIEILEFKAIPIILTYSKRFGIAHKLSSFKMEITI